MIYEIELTPREHRLLMQAIEKQVAALMETQARSEDEGYKRMVVHNLTDHLRVLNQLRDMEVV